MPPTEGRLAALLAVGGMLGPVCPSARGDVMEVGGSPPSDRVFPVCGPSISSATPPRHVRARGGAKCSRDTQSVGLRTGVALKFSSFAGRPVCLIQRWRRIPEDIRVGLLRCCTECVADASIILDTGLYFRLFGSADGNI